MSQAVRLHIGIFFVSAVILAGGVFLYSRVVHESLVIQAYAEETQDEKTEEEKKKEEEEQKAREEDIKDTQKDIEKKEDKIEDKESEVSSLKQNLNAIQSNLYATREDIQETESTIQTVQETIERKKDELEFLEKKLDEQKQALADMVRQRYYFSQVPIAEVVVRQESFSVFMQGRDYAQTFQESVRALVDETVALQEKITDEKHAVEEKKEEKEQLLAVREAQEQQLAAQHQSTSQTIARKEASLADLRKELSKLRSNLSGLLGEKYDTDDIVDAAKFASKATGVRKDYLLGVLVVESNLGRYTGGCDYKESRMSSYRKDIFKGICKELDYNYKKQKVSCPPSGYNGTGGAMGVAQFMPDTWLGYKSSIASATGHNPPDPWNLVDGVTAMALKLAKVSGVTKHKESAEAKAYCVYLAGNNWAAYCDNKGTNYGSLVLYWADNYEKKL